jgi:anti-sigma factor RsiW
MKGKEGIAMFSKMSNKMMNCEACQDHLSNLLLDPSAPGNGAARAHIDSCPDCARTLADLESTMALLDTWQAPEVSPYFDQKLAVLLREEQAAPAPGWFERLRTHILLNTGRQFRPALAGAMALLLIIGGGTVGITAFPHSQPQAVQASATVNDLQILDKNEQALQQLDQMLQETAPADDGNAGPPQT